jgi:putative peptidoglycan lipid II flippase
VLGFVRTYLFAQVVAASVAADAFTQANNLPTQLFIIISTGVVNGVLIPQITKAMRRSDGGQDFINRLLTLALLVIAGMALITTLATPWLINLIVSAKANAGAPGYLHLAILLGYWCMPQVFFYGLYAVLGQVLNARGHFTVYAWAPALANVVQIVGLVWFWVQWGYQPNAATWSTSMIVVLGASTTGGIALQALWLIWPLYRDGFRFRPRFGWRGYGFGDISRMTMWTLAAVLVNVLTSLFISWVATATRAGDANFAGNASQQYAYSLFILPHSLIMVSIVTALFPAMADAWATHDDSRLKALMNQGLTQPAVLIIPASMALIGIGMPIIHTLYGGLDATEAVNVWWVTAAYAIGTWPFGIQALRQRYYFAMQDGWTNFWLVLVQTVAQLAAALIAVYALPGQYGVMAIALGQSVGAIAATIIFLILVRRDLRSFDFGGIFGLWAKLALASAVAALGGWDVTQIMGFAASSRAWAPIMLLASAGVFCLVFYMMSLMLNIKPVTSLVDRFVSRLRRRGLAAPRPPASEGAEALPAAAVVPVPHEEVPQLAEVAPMPPPQPWMPSRKQPYQLPPDPRDMTTFRGLNTGRPEHRTRRDTSSGRKPGSSSL